MKKQVIFVAGVALLALGYAAFSQPAPQSFPGCVYRTSLPTLANRQTTAINCTINGAIIGTAS